MPEECPKCGLDRCADPKDPFFEKERKLIDSSEAFYDDNIHVTWKCGKCGFKWIEFYQEHEWASFEEYKGDGYCSWRSPEKPYIELHRDSF